VLLEACFELSLLLIRFTALLPKQQPKPHTCVIVITPCYAVVQAFQCSEQAVQLAKDGWFVPESEPSGVSKMRNPKEPNVEQAVIVASEWLVFWG
jgi:hypothetical protein